MQAITSLFLPRIPWWDAVGKRGVWWVHVSPPLWGEGLLLSVLFYLKPQSGRKLRAHHNLTLLV